MLPPPPRPISTKWKNPRHIQILFQIYTVQHIIVSHVTKAGKVKADVGTAPQHSTNYNMRIGPIVNIQFWTNFMQCIQHIEQDNMQICAKSNSRVNARLLAHKVKFNYILAINCDFNHHARVRTQANILLFCYMCHMHFTEEIANMYRICIHSKRSMISTYKYMWPKIRTTICI